METKPTKEDGTVELTETQLEIVGQFDDFSFKNANMTYEPSQRLSSEYYAVL